MTSAFRRPIPVLLALLLTFGTLALAAPACLQAQALGTSTVAVDSAVAFTLASAPDPGEWRASTTAGFRFEDGRVDSRGYSVGVDLAYTSGSGLLWRAEADWQRSEARPEKGAPMYVIDDTRFAALSATRMLSGSLGLMAMTSWREDRPLELDHRIMAQAGPVFALGNHRTFSLAAVPMVGWGTQNNALGDDSESIVNFGGVQTLTWHASPWTTLQAYVSGHRVVDDADDYSFTVNTSISGALSRNLGVNVFYRLYQEGIQPPGVARAQHTIGAGFKLMFPSLTTGGD